MQCYWCRQFMVLALLGIFVCVESQGVVCSRNHWTWRTSAEQAWRGTTSPSLLRWTMHTMCAVHAIWHPTHLTFAPPLSVFVHPSFCLHLSVRPSAFVCPSVCLHLCVRLSVRPSVRPSVCLRLFVCVCPFVCPSVCLHLSVHPSLHLCVRLSVYICPSVRITNDELLLWTLWRAVLESRISW